MGLSVPLIYHSVLLVLHMINPSARSNYVTQLAHLVNVSLSLHQFLFRSQSLGAPSPSSFLYPHHPTPSISTLHSHQPAFPHLEMLMFSLTQPPHLGLLSTQDAPGTSLGIWDTSIYQHKTNFCHFLLQRIFPIQGLKPYLLHWQADSLPLYHLGSLILVIQDLNLPIFPHQLPQPFFFFFWSKLRIVTEHSIGLENGEIVLVLVFQEGY